MFTIYLLLNCFLSHISPSVVAWAALPMCNEQLSIATGKWSGVDERGVGEGSRGG